MQQRSSHSPCKCSMLCRLSGSWSSVAGSRSAAPGRQGSAARVSLGLAGCLILPEKLCPGG